MPGLEFRRSHFRHAHLQNHRQVVETQTPGPGEGYAELGLRLEQLHDRVCIVPHVSRYAIAHQTVTLLRFKKAPQFGRGTACRVSPGPCPDEVASTGGNAREQIVNVRRKGKCVAELSGTRAKHVEVTWTESVPVQLNPHLRCHDGTTQKELRISPFAFSLQITEHAFALHAERFPYRYCFQLILHGHSGSIAESMSRVYTCRTMKRKRLKERFVNGVFRAVLRIVCRADTADLNKITRSGPVILISNHTTNIEGPAIYVLIQPRPATALGKVELWQNPVTRLVMDAWGIIPVRRGTVDSTALRASLRALDDGKLLGVAPEGTRSKSGNLKRGERGAALLAVRSGAPVYPAAQWGFRDIGSNLKRLRRTPVTFRVGPPFTVQVPGNRKPSATDLRQIADEMMYQIAVLLPEKFRGVYSDLSAMTTEYLRFLG